MTPEELAAGGITGIAGWLVVISFLAMALCLFIALWSMALDYAREEGGIMGLLPLALVASLTTFLFSIAFLEATR